MLVVELHHHVSGWLLLCALFWMAFSGFLHGSGNLLLWLRRTWSFGLSVSNRRRRRSRSFRSGGFEFTTLPLLLKLILALLFLLLVAVHPFIPLRTNQHQLN